MHYAKIKSYLKLAVEEGGQILTGEGVDRQGNFYSYLIIFLQIIAIFCHKIVYEKYR